MVQASDAQSPQAFNQNQQGLSLFDFGLYSATIFAWGFSWYAVKLQAVIAPEIALFWRFLFAGRA